MGEGGRTLNAIKAFAVFKVHDRHVIAKGAMGLGQPAAFPGYVCHLTKIRVVTGRRG